MGECLQGGFLPRWGAQLWVGVSAEVGPLPLGCMVGGQGSQCKGLWGEEPHSRTPPWGRVGGHQWGFGGGPLPLVPPLAIPSQGPLPCPKTPPATHQPASPKAKAATFGWVTPTDTRPWEGQRGPRSPRGGASWVTTLPVTSRTPQPVAVTGTGQGVLGGRGHRTPNRARSQSVPQQTVTAGCAGPPPGWAPVQPPRLRLAAGTPHLGGWVPAS